MKKNSKRLAAGLKNVENHITELTGIENYFTFITKGQSRIAVFRRLSFIPPDETAMIRLRLQNEVKPLVKNSVMSGLYIGDIAIDSQGEVAAALDENRIKLLKYLLSEPMGIYPVEKKGSGTFKILYPGEFAETLTGYAETIIKEAPEVSIKDFQWQIKMPGFFMHTGRFKEFCEINADENLFADIMGLSGYEKVMFKKLSSPALLHAFGKTVCVSGLMRPEPQIAYQASDIVMGKLFEEYEKVKTEFLNGKTVKNSPRHKFPKISGTAGIEIFHPKYFVPLNLHSKPLVKIPSGRNNALYREIAGQQYLYLKDCCSPKPVKTEFEGRSYTGIVSAPDPTIYYPIWPVDHFFNTLAMADFNIDTAKKMLIGGLIYFMDLHGKDAGALPVKKANGKKGSTYPVWMLAAADVYNKSRDVELLKTIFPLLELHNRYINNFLLKNGIYVGAGGFWNDYSTGPKKNGQVAGIGINSMIAMEKKLLAVFAEEIGQDKSTYINEYEKLTRHINEFFWDEDTGFYFDYDADNRKIFKTLSGEYFWGLDNILPLLGGFVTEERAERMEKYLLSSNYYGKYPAITTDFSSDFMDERRLMVWVMTNWLVIQGLNCYGLDRPSSTISANIFNALLKSWTESHCLPEALSATHGMYKMENANLAGVGSWAGFYLYLKEIYFKDEANVELHKQIRSNFK